MVVQWKETIVVPETDVSNLIQRKGDTSEDEPLNN